MRDYGQHVNLWATVNFHAVFNLLLKIIDFENSTLRKKRADAKFLLVRIWKFFA